MSGKLKKALAILAALGISASAVTDFLNHVMATFPNPKLHVVCTGIITLIGLCVAYFNVSIKDPSADKPSIPESAADKAASQK